MLFVDVDGDGQISNAHEYVFTEWDAGSDDDMEALRAAFDTNGDGWGRAVSPLPLFSFPPRPAGGDVAEWSKAHPC